MKRSRLTRKTPMPRPTKPMKRSWIKRMSSKKRQEIAATKVPRKLYRDSLCMLCRKRQADDVHEIARGVHRSLAVKEPCTWLALCRQCHDAMGDYSVWPIVRQLALKQDRDEDFYDLAKFNALRGRAQDAITQSEVDQHREWWTP